MNSENKNKINAVLASTIQVGDTVQVIKTKKTGVVTKKVVYDREHQIIWNSPYGYTSIQVTFDDNCKRNYSARSLRIIMSKN